MRWWHSLIISGLLLLAFAAVGLSQYKVKAASSLSEKVQNLWDMSSKKPVLRFDSQKFREYVRSDPRNYSTIVMLTALASKRQCQICQLAFKEYTIAANSYRYSNDYSNELFFVMIDFDEATKVFQQLKINTAPVFMHFPAIGKPKQSDTMDIQRVGFGAEAIASFIKERTGKVIRIFRPPDYSGAFITLTLMGMVGGFLYIRRNNLEFLYNRTIWGIIAMGFCFAMISGQMWNHIRSPPLLHRSQNGGIAYIHGSSQGQLVVESYIIICLNAFIALGMIMLIESNSPKAHNKGRWMAIAGLVMLTVFFSLLLSVFRSKAQGYPYSFLFK